MLGPVERKNSWQLAEHAGYRDPYTFQYLLGRAAWDVDALRDALQDYIGQQLGTRGGILVLDETGFLKKSTQSAGVARQYSGTAGRTENCQMGVFLAYVHGEQMTLIDRALYLPASWTEDQARCARAGIPATVPFATKPTLGRQMLAHAIAARFAPAWVVADEVYGRDGALRRFLVQHRRAYVLAIAANTPVRTELFRQQRPDQCQGAPKLIGLGQVAPGDCSPGAPSDPDVRDYRIRLLGLWFRCVTVHALDYPRSGQGPSTEKSPESLPGHAA